MVWEEESASAGFSSGGFVISPAVRTGWFQAQNNGYSLYKEVHGDFRMSAYLRLTIPPGTEEFSNAGLIFRVPAACVPPDQEKVWFLLDHGVQDHITGSSSGGASYREGFLWKENLASPTDAGYTTNRHFSNLGATSPVRIAMCRRGNTVTAAYDLGGGWIPFTQVFTNSVLTGIPIHAGLTAGIFGNPGPDAGMIQADFDNVVFEPFTRDGGPCVP